MGAVLLPDGDHVARYCKPSAVGQDGIPLPAAFELRPKKEDYLSVNWLEFLDASDIEAAVAHVRTVFPKKGYRVKPSGRFAVLEVGEVKAAISAMTGTARVEHRRRDDDESHSGVFGYTADDFAVAVEIAALVDAECVHPAAADKHPQSFPDR